MNDDNNSHDLTLLHDNHQTTSFNVSDAPHGSDVDWLHPRVNEILKNNKNDAFSVDLHENITP